MFEYNQAHAQTLSIPSATTMSVDVKQVVSQLSQLLTYWTCIRKDEGNRILCGFKGHLKLGIFQTSFPTELQPGLWP